MTRGARMAKCPGCGKSLHVWKGYVSACAVYWRWDGKRWRKRKRGAA